MHTDALTFGFRGGATQLPRCYFPGFLELCGEAD